MSVVEILRAAVVMLKPIRSGTVKAQAKGIIRDIHNNGNTTLGRQSLRAGKSLFFFIFNHFASL